jgi:hypothetical protein
MAKLVWINRVTIENGPTLIFTPEEWKQMKGYDGFGKNGLPLKINVTGIEYTQVTEDELKNRPKMIGF